MFLKKWKKNWASVACLQPCEHERGERRPRAQEWMREGEQSERQQREDDREGSRARGEKVQRGVGDCDAHRSTLLAADWPRCLPVRGAGSRALLEEQIMKRSATSGSLLLLSQWLHTHSSSAPSPCCPLSAGLGSRSTTKKHSQDLPMTKCLRSWTGGNSISKAVNRGGV